MYPCQLWKASLNWDFAECSAAVICNGHTSEEGTSSFHLYDLAHTYWSLRILKGEVSESPSDSK